MSSWHLFTWEGQAESVVVTGSFDEWSCSTLLVQVRPSHWEASLPVRFGEKVLYKFVIDGQWQHDSSQPTETDPSGAVNNVLQISSLHIPSIPRSIPLNFLALTRDVEVLAWNGHSLAVLAGFQTQPALTLAVLCSVLNLVLVVEGPYALARLFEGEKDHYEVEEHSDEAREVTAGFFLVAQPAQASAPSLKLPLPTLASHTLFYSAPSSSQGSTESFSTALDTSSSFSFSHASSAAGEEYVKVLEIAKWWDLAEGVEEEEMKRAWFEGRVVLVTQNNFTPLALHPSTLTLARSLRFCPPLSSTSEERREIESYITRHLLTSANRWVKGPTAREEDEDDEDGEDLGGWSAQNSEWEEVSERSARL